VRAVSGSCSPAARTTPTRCTIFTAKDLRKVELTGGNLKGPNREERRQLERGSAEAAESAYQRNVADWQRQQTQRAKKTTAKT
jgi:hypothetical protein